MPNPTGKNQLPGGQHELPYGDVKKATQLTREAPLSGAPVSALNAPRRAQRAAVRGGKARASAQPVPAQPALAERPSPDAVVAGPPAAGPPVAAPAAPDATAFWSEVAGLPGVSPLAREYAQRAALGGGV